MFSSINYKTRTLGLKVLKLIFVFTLPNNISLLFGFLNYGLENICNLFYPISIFSHGKGIETKTQN